MANFFVSQTEESAIKTRIVVDYFATWSKIMVGPSLNERRLAYVELFAGEGRYEGGEASTPLQVLDVALKSATVRDRLVALFVDEHKRRVEKLTSEIRRLPGVELFPIAPLVVQERLDTAQPAVLASIRRMPVFAFIDPFGYAGLTKRLVENITEGFGCEAVFFFPDSRIPGAVANPGVRHHMDALFGAARRAALERDLQRLKPRSREAAIRAALEEALLEKNQLRMISLKFRRKSGQRHSICFVTKHPLPFQIMKDILAKYSHIDADGVPTYEHLSASAQRQLELPVGSLQSLPGLLLEQFAGRALKVGEVALHHGFGRPFLKRNYKRVLTELAERGEVVLDPPKSARGLGDGTLVRFPKAIL